MEDLSVWEKNGKKRGYLDFRLTREIIGLDVTLRGTSRYGYSADGKGYLDDEEISRNEANRIIRHFEDTYYDFISEKWHFSEYGDYSYLEERIVDYFASNEEEDEDEGETQNLHTFRDLFEIYPDEIRDGQVVTDFGCADGILEFPFAINIRNAVPDENGRYRASEIGLYHVVCRDRWEFGSARKAWLGDDVGLSEGRAPATYESSTIKTVRFAENVKTIGEIAFQYCRSLKEVYLPEGLECIDTKAFIRCYALEELRIPDTVRYIGKRAFEDCYSLKSVNIPGETRRICDLAFNGCRSITELHIPSVTEYVGKGAFRDCSALMNIYVDQAESDLLANVDLPRACTIHWKQDEKTSD